MTYCGWGARIRTWDHGTKARCLTAWPRPNPLGWLFAPRAPAPAVSGLIDEIRQGPLTRLPHRMSGAVLPASAALGNGGATEACLTAFVAGPCRAVYIHGSSASRSVAQPGSAPASGAGGREFESPHSDQHLSMCWLANGRRFLVVKVVGLAQKPGNPLNPGRQAVPTVTFCAKSDGKLNAAKRAAVPSPVCSARIEAGSTRRPTRR